MTESNTTHVPIYLTNSSNPDGPRGIYPSNVSTIWTNGVEGQPNTALHFDGTASYIDTTISSNFNFTTNLFTINLWVRPATRNGFLMQNEDASKTNGWYLSVGGSYEVWFGTETNGGGSSFSTAPGAAQVGVWDMVTMVRTDPTNVLVYINGRQATNGLITSPASSTNNLILGVDSTGENHLDGDMWLPQIWSIALSPTDIANLYCYELFGFPWP
jgi:hypothetical protein